MIQQQKDSQNDNKSESVVEQNKENEAFVQNHSEEKPQQEQVELEKHASENNQTLHSKAAQSNEDVKLNLHNSIIQLPNKKTLKKRI